MEIENLEERFNEVSGTFPMLKYEQRKLQEELNRA